MGQALRCIPPRLVGCWRARQTPGLGRWGLACAHLPRPRVALEVEREQPLEHHVVRAYARLLFQLRRARAGAPQRLFPPPPPPPAAPGAACLQLGRWQMVPAARRKARENGTNAHLAPRCGLDGLARLHFAACGTRHRPPVVGTTHKAQGRCSLRRIARSWPAQYNTAHRTR